MQTLVDSGQIECSGEPVPRAQALQALAESDYLLLLDVCGPQAGLQVPSKTFEYLQIGRPVLTFTTRDSPLNGSWNAAASPVSVFTNPTPTRPWMRR